MRWQERAAALAAAVTHPGSRWRAPVASIPRHALIPAWWHGNPDSTGRARWHLRRGPDDTEQWLDTAYTDQSVITSAAGHHADRARDTDAPLGRPTSSATLPSLVVRMYQRALIEDGHDLVDVGTGSGYGTALAARRLGEARVTSVDVDPYLVEAARDRLATLGLQPRLETVDATAELPCQADRIVATVAVRPVPAAWLAALRTGGRLVTTIAGTSLVITATKREDGSAWGQVEWEPAGFMNARHKAGNYPPGVGRLLTTARTANGDMVTPSPYPVVDVASAWDLASMLDVAAPGIVHGYQEEDDGRRTALMAHPDGSWARAVGRGEPASSALVHQGGPRRLWDVLDHIRGTWLTRGELPIRGARVRILPDGTTQLASGDWRATL